MGQSYAGPAQLRRHVDEELVVGVAGAPGIAIQNARPHEGLAEATLLEERDRIARDLHDKVIHRLFAHGLTLQGAARLSVRPEVASRLEQAVVDLDDTVREIRTTIFQLETARIVRRRSPRSEVLDLTEELGRSLGFSPGVVRGAGRHPRRSRAAGARADGPAGGVDQRGPSRRRHPRRRRRLAGTCEVGAGPNGGTRLVWVVPLGD